MARDGSLSRAMKGTTERWDYCRASEKILTPSAANQCARRKNEVVAAWKTGGWRMADLCREFGISRKTGYKYLERYEERGRDGLKDGSHAAHRQPNKTSQHIVEMIVEMREKHSSWGPDTLLAALRGRYPGLKKWPAASTVGEILKREGLVKTRRKRRQNPVKLYPLSHVQAPNDVWCTDFKGHFTVRNGRRCDPLTITDAHSRYLLECKAVQKTDSECYSIR